MYHLLRLSDFVREGIEHSGSYRFADHLYRNEPSGRFWLGRHLDRWALNTRAARAMRARCEEASAALERELDATSGGFRVLAIPCGIPRDVSNLAKRRPELAARLRYIGMDVDEEVIAAAQEHLEQEGGVTYGTARWLHGNALVDLDYPEHPVDFAVSTGLGEFLDDAQLRRFYRHVFACLKPGGCFFTSATRRESGSDYLLRAFELHTHYRTREELREILSELPWRHLELTQDATGLQTFVSAWR